MLKSELPVISFKSQKAWATWLAKNHSKSNGVWIHCYKKNSGIRSITRIEALDEALCYGWIDGQAKGVDEKSWLQKFTPRRSKSIWSKINIENIQRLTDAGKMKPSGLKEVELAKQDGRWEKAYDSPSSSQVPEDFLKKLSANKKAKEFFETLNRSNVYAITWRLQTAKKEETREKRMNLILEMLAAGKKFH
jgi:uncharacterized protein YdeI (YjbR/CyaY-like superfamily)